MKFLAFNELLTLETDALKTLLEGTNQQIEANDGRLTVGSSAELDSLLDMRDDINEILRRRAKSNLTSRCL